MAHKPKIMILYASYGDGHYQAAKAIEASLCKCMDCSVVLLDLMAEAHPLLNELTKFIYMQSFKTFPQLYGWVYNMTKGMQSESPFANWLHSFGLGKLSQYLDREDPDLVIHTFPQLGLPKLRRTAGFHLPIVNVVTDFDLHGRWLHPDIDRYYVATDDLKSEAEAKGIAAQRIVATGIPLKSMFSSASHEKVGMSLQLKLDHGKRTVLIMGGAYGVMQDISDICERLQHQPDIQQIIVCGRNRELKETLKKRFAGDSSIHIFGFVEQIQSLMHASDCIITKPGGITLSESLSCRLPIFIYKPVPGQERNNALYLQKKGAAVIAYNPAELTRELVGILHDPDREAAMVNRIEALCKPQAADHIAEDIWRQWFQPVQAVLQPV
ncbi:glycosyltransferase [Paenibacillus sp. JX-17]|uniref:Glycosyltransferase n=1 Tax=Paenibacillus lacisoli TaxID=3064525 RepID=A0ABT9CBL5_9BACL|nr:glycosyltransferase [Paenibacillus sp. JX-17]MDO7906646.1 glycosyltransferase [Paenibacillus sp. JX-17]